MLDFKRISKISLMTIVVIAILLLAIRAVLPFAIERYVNKTIDRLPDYDGRIDDVDLSLFRGAYEIEGIDIVKTEGEVPVPFFSSEKMDLSIQWSELFHGALVGEIGLESPKLNFVVAPTEEDSQKKVDKSWTEVVQDLFPVRINRFEINNGEVHFRNFHSEPKVDIFLENLDITALNLTNSGEISESLYASIDAYKPKDDYGELRLHLDIDPYAKQPTFDLDGSLKDVNLVKLNDFLRVYSKVDVERGSLSLFTEMSASNGNFEGYVKPLLKDLDVLNVEKEEENPLKVAWEAIVGGVAELFENQPKGQLGTKIPISGRFKNPDVGVWSSIGNLLVNAFIRALTPGLEGTINLGDTEQQGSKE